MYYNTIFPGIQEQLCKFRRSAVPKVRDPSIPEKSLDILPATSYNLFSLVSGCSADGSVLGSGPRGRGFKSPHSDHRRRGLCIVRDGVFFFKANAISHSLRRSSSQNATRFAGLAFVFVDAGDLTGKKACHSVSAVSIRAAKTLYRSAAPPLQTGSLSADFRFGLAPYLIISCPPLQSQPKCNTIAQ